MKKMQCKVSVAAERLGNVCPLICFHTIMELSGRKWYFFPDTGIRYNESGNAVE